MLQLHIHAKFKSVDEWPNDYFVHLGEFGKANGFSQQALNPCAQHEMFPFQLLGPPFADHRLAWTQVSVVRPPVVGVKTAMGFPE